MSLIGPVLWTLTVLAAGSENTHLSSMNAGCVLEQESWAPGSSSSFSGTWLRCAEARFLLVHPINLLGKVRVSTPEQALEYVRFFSPDRSYFFRLGGAIELTPGSSHDCYVVPEALFKKHLVAPRAILVSPDPATADAGLCSNCRAFEVVRSVAFPDMRVYELHERVLENGYYDVGARKLLLDDLSKAGTTSVCSGL